MATENLALLITILLFAIGFVSSFLPIFPGNLIVWLGVLVHKIMMGDASVSWTFFWLATILTITAQGLDLLFSYWGARRFGSSWQGALGGIVGGILGVIFFNLPGLILGPVAGVVIVEMARGGNLRKAGRAGFGTIVGGFVAFLVKLVFTCIIIAGFFVSLARWFQ